MQGRFDVAGARAGQVPVFRSDGRRLVSIGPDGELKIWDTARVRQPALLARLRTRRRVVAAAWNPEAADLLATLSANGGLSVWRIVDGAPPRPIWSVDRSIAGATTLTWLTDGRHLACGTPYGDISVWDTVGDVRRTAVGGRDEPCLAVAPSPEGGLLMAFQDGAIFLLCPLIPGGIQIADSLPAITAACWSPAATRLAVAGETGSIEMLDSQFTVMCVPDGSFGAKPVLGWAGESVLLVIDRAAHALTAIDDSGRTRWRSQLPRLPSAMSWSVAAGMVALSGGTTPLIIDLERGDFLSAP